MIWTKAEDAELLRLRKLGWSFAEIRVQLKRSRGSVMGRYYRITRKTLKLWRRSPRVNIALGLVLMCRMSPKDAANKLGINDTSIYYRIAKHHRAEYRRLYPLSERAERAGAAVSKTRRSTPDWLKEEMAL